LSADTNIIHDRIIHTYQAEQCFDKSFKNSDKKKHEFREINLSVLNEYIINMHAIIASSKRNNRAYTTISPIKVNIGSISIAICL